MTTTMLLIALGATLVGVAVGYLINKATHPDEKQRKKLEEELLKSREELSQYQHQVTAHFLETSTHFNELTEQYRHLHEHLARGAMDLASPEISQQIASAGQGKLGDGGVAVTLSGEMPTPPKDYAPKVPGGVLSENYGLREEAQKKDAPGATIVGLAVQDSEDDEGDPTLKVG